MCNQELVYAIIVERRVVSVRMGGSAVHARSVEVAVFVCMGGVAVVARTQWDCAVLKVPKIPLSESKWRAQQSCSCNLPLNETPDS